MASQVDLRQLASRAAPSAGELPRRQRWLIRWVLPLAIVLGFSGLAIWAAREYWLPARPVTVTPVILAKAEVQEAGTPLFRAAGWIEPRPSAVVASALVEGVVEELLIVEGQEVKAQEPIARLVDADARLALQEAEAALQLREAERDVIQATLDAAAQNVEHPVHLEAALAEADAQLAELNTQIKNLPFLVRAAEARATFARQDLEGKKSVQAGLPTRAVQKSQSEFDAAQAELDDLRQRGPQLESQREAYSRRCEALKSRLELKTDEQRAWGEAKANLAAAAAKVSQARLAVDAANLRLQRMTVRAPITGRVLSLHARTGQRLMGLSPASERESSTVALLYEPAKLQVRADVRLEDVPQVQIGQPAQISTAATGETLRGRVLTMTSQADILKNTLSVKVAIDNPPQVVRPEMLAQVTFLAPQRPGDKSAGVQDPLRLLIPRSLIERGEEGSSVWVADPASGVARRKAVQLGRASVGELLEVVQGLSALDKLIVSGRDSLREGERIRITGEDQTLGTASSTASSASAADSKKKQN